MIGKYPRPDPDSSPDRVAACLADAAYSSFYDLIAIALETGNVSGALSRLNEAGEYLPLTDLNRLRRELEGDYFVFTD